MGIWLGLLEGHNKTPASQCFTALWTMVQLQLIKHFNGSKWYCSALNWYETFHSYSLSIILVHRLLTVRLKNEKCLTFWKERRKESKKGERERGVEGGEGERKHIGFSCQRWSEVSLCAYLSGCKVGYCKIGVHSLLIWKNNVQEKDTTVNSHPGTCT